MPDVWHTKMLLASRNFHFILIKLNELLITRGMVVFAQAAIAYHMVDEYKRAVFIQLLAV